MGIYGRAKALDLIGSEGHPSVCRALDDHDFHLNPPFLKKTFFFGQIEGGIPEPGRHCQLDGLSGEASPGEKKYQAKDSHKPYLSHSIFSFLGIYSSISSRWGRVKAAQIYQ
jgi:hypothetical protein